MSDMSGARAGNDSVPHHLDCDRLREMAQIARYHREHERFYAMRDLELAADLRRESNALKALADGWLRAAGGPGPSPDGQPPGAHFRALGCEDLSDVAAVAATGILFMEGEGEPLELSRLRQRLGETSRALAETAEQLDRHMDAAWQRELALLSPALARAAYHRFEVLTRTTLASRKKEVASRLLATSHQALQNLDLRPAGLRADLLGAARLLLTASWLLDMGAGVLADQAGEFGLLDPDWTAYVEELQGFAGPEGRPASPGHEEG
jgi:hypothetical protein